MKPVNVVVTSKCEADIQAIVDYYLSHGASPLRFLNAIADSIAHLEAFADTAVRRRDLTRRDVYFWLVNPYWMVLKRTDVALDVLTVTHASRKLGKTIGQRLKEFDD